MRTNSNTETVFFCKECGYESKKWMGQCPACHSWNTFCEEPVTKTTGSPASGKRSLLPAQRPVTLREIEAQTGCIGLCQYEPIVEVMAPGKEKVTYVKMTPEKALEVLRLHLLGGQVVTKYTLSAAQEKAE